MTRKIPRMPPERKSTGIDLSKGSMTQRPPEKTHERRASREDKSKASIQLVPTPTATSSEILEAHETAYKQIIHACDQFLEEQHCRTPEEEHSARLLFYGALVNPSKGINWPRDHYDKPVFDQLIIDGSKLMKTIPSRGEKSTEINALIQQAKHRIHQHQLYLSSVPADHVQTQKIRMQQELISISRYCKHEPHHMPLQELSTWLNSKDDGDLERLQKQLYTENLIAGNNELTVKGKRPKNDFERSEKLIQDLESAKRLSKALVKWSQQKTKGGTKTGRTLYKPRHKDLSYIPPQQRAGKTLFAVMLDESRPTTVAYKDRENPDLVASVSEEDIRLFQQYYQTSFPTSNTERKELPKNENYTLLFPELPEGIDSMPESDRANPIEKHNEEQIQQQEMRKDQVKKKLDERHAIRLSKLASSRDQSGSRLARTAVIQENINRLKGQSPTGKKTRDQ